MNRQRSRAFGASRTGTGRDEDVDGGRHTAHPDPRASASGATASQVHGRVAHAGAARPRGAQPWRAHSRPRHRLHQDTKGEQYEHNS